MQSESAGLGRQICMIKKKKTILHSRNSRGRKGVAVRQACGDQLELPGTLAPRR
jgi:hypothetical protein